MLNAQTDVGLNNLVNILYVLKDGKDTLKFVTDSGMLCSLGYHASKALI
jgi:hypothetical protein